MRELRHAAKEGPRAFLASASRLPHRHPWMLGSAVGALALALLTFGLADTRRDVQVLQPQVTEIVREAEACRANATRHELRSCVRRIEIALRRCQHSTTCRTEFKRLLEAVPHRSTRGGDARLPAPAGQQPRPGVRPGGREGRGQRPGGGRRTDRPSRPDARSVPDQSPAPAPPAPTAPQPVVPPPPPPQPGNSGTTPGAGTGTKACVDLIVSACVQGPRLSP